MIVVHAAFPIAADQRDQALEVFRDLVEASHNEPGVIKYEAATDVSDSNLIRNVEQYEDEDAFQAHLETDHVQDFEEVLPDLLAGEPDIVRFEVDSATDVDF
jgi:quinol monooxygenase YgiN